jgi:hypothetical protein
MLSADMHALLFWVWAGDGRAHRRSRPNGLHGRQQAVRILPRPLRAVFLLLRAVGWHLGAVRDGPHSHYFARGDC